MSTTRQTRRASSFLSSTTSSMAKRQTAAASSGPEKGVHHHNKLTQKRAPLGDITNSIKNASHPAPKGSRTAAPPPSSSLVPCSNKILMVKKGPCLGSNGTSFSGSVLGEKKPTLAIASKVAPVLRTNDGVSSTVSTSSVVRMDVSPTKSDGEAVSMDGTISTCDSFKSPQVEYIDSNDVPAVESISRKTIGDLYISDNVEPAGYPCSLDSYVDMETDDRIVNVDDNFEDPQLCATIACDIYKHLRSSESKKRPATDFMERVQKDINASMRSILIDWLVEVSEEYRLVPDTLYLTVNYVDRYLSGNVMNRQRLQLLGVACMMIAAKYEEICAPQVEEFCYITDNTYFRDEVLEMESSVLNYLKFEMTAPTPKCFLRRFVRVAQGVNEVPSMQFECLANYITELSLLEYNMLCYAPSLIAASATFFAKFVLFPSKRPWNPTLQHYTCYRPSELYDCVKDLHRLCCGNCCSTLPAVREKYSQQSAQIQICSKEILPSFNTSRVLPRPTLLEMLQHPFQ